ncbi:hypothetical protein AV530_004488 [Patagioenas fasciata monilis]|uniref:Uncharacterized protein n=1 Tax=Patagioenas fasciata monilis TaxID=372326 RepID=A0A1V4JCU7_PATFA|nr:hypothetical protein AV530_004488 [Patagioenas fasciata monilis]
MSRHAPRGSSPRGFRRAGPGAAEGAGVRGQAELLGKLVCKRNGREHRTLILQALLSSGPRGCSGLQTRF